MEIVTNPKQLFRFTDYPDADFVMNKYDCYIEQVEYKKVSERTLFYVTDTANDYNRRNVGLDFYENFYFDDDDEV